LRPIDFTRLRLLEVSAIYMMVKNLSQKAWKLPLLLMTLLSQHTEIIAKLWQEVITPRLLLQKWPKRKLVQVVVRVDLCIIITQKIISMVEMVLLVLRFQLELG